MSQTEVKYPPFKTKLPNDVLKKAIKELTEDPNTRNQEIKFLRERLQAYPGLRCRLDSEFLIRFLRCKKFDQERTFQAILNYYRMRNQYPLIYQNLTPSAVKNVLDGKIIAALNGRDKSGRKILMSKIANWDHENVSFERMFSVCVLSLMKVIQDEETQVNGIIFISDLEGFSAAQAKCTNPITSGKLSNALQENFPIRFKGAHYIKEHSIFDMLFAVFKTFLSQKLLDRIHFHGHRLEELKEFIDEEFIPEELGGKAASFDEQAEEWNKCLRECENEFEEEPRYGLFDTVAVSSKESKKEDAFNDVTGSFKKLEV